MKHSFRCDAEAALVRTDRGTPGPGVFTRRSR